MCARPGLRPVPSYTSSLIGREAEIEYLDHLIDDPNTRLITITGTAGVGKTRLATAIGGSVDKPDVVFVSLMSVRDANLVLPEIGRALSIQSDDLLNSIRGRLANFDGLLVLDNFEQVIDASSEIARIIPGNPKLTVLITSQRPLQQAGEHVLRLQPLSIPNAGVEAKDILSTPSVQLLVQRATEQDSSFPESLRDASASQSVAEICRRLDGIPLALELAASRLNSLTPEVMLKQLDRGQSILSSRRRDIPERQRTMHSAIQWSFQLLSSDTQRVFLWLGAFSSGFVLPIVERVSEHLGISSPSIDTISELVNQSMIQRVKRGVNPWYEMLVSIRDFCLATLTQTGDQESAQALVGRHVLELAGETERQLTGPNPGGWASILDQQRSTVRSAVDWALDHEDPELPMLVATGLTRYMEKEGRWHEAIGWINQALSWRDQLDDEVLIAGLIAKISLQEDARHLNDAHETASEVHLLLRGKDLPAHEINFLVRLGNIAQDQQEFDAAIEHYERALALAELHERKRDITMARTSIGFISFFRGDYQAAYVAFRQVKDSFEELQDVTALAVTLSNLAAATMNLQRPEEAISYLDQAIEIDREIGSTRDLIFPLLNKAGTLIMLGEFEEAETILLEGIELAHQINHRMLEATGCLNLADIAIRKDEPHTAIPWMGRALSVMTLDDGIRLYAEIGWLLSHSLAQQEKYADAARMLAKSVSLADEEEVVIETTSWDHIHKVSGLVEEHLDDPDAERRKGESWSTEDYIRNLRRYVSGPRSILVKVQEKSQSAFPSLTAREREILELLTKGRSTRSMAELLNVSPRTITTHIGNMMAKTEVNSRTELVAKYLLNLDSTSK